MPLRHALLGLLDWRPMHGYKLRQYAKEYSWIYPMTNASIYPALHTLEQEGFVAHHSEIHNGRARKVYAITDAGRRELRHWLESPTAAPQSLRDQMLLKIAMQRDETMDVSRQWIERALADLDEEIQRHDRQVRTADDRLGYASIAMEYGADMLQLRRRLLQRVLDECLPRHAAPSLSA